jgi:hypothetical protein
MTERSLRERGEYWGKRTGVAEKSIRGPTFHSTGQYVL